MQWTAELDALLNQCVFECGYDFTAAAALLASRAKQLRLVSGDQLTLTSDECQVEWMAINPVVEDEEPYDGDGGGDDLGGDVYFRRSAAALHDDAFHFYRRHHEEQSSDIAADVSLSTLDVGTHDDDQDGDELRQAGVVGDEADDAVREAATAVDIPEGCPKLELSLSDAELDALLNSLPTSTTGTPEDEYTATFVSADPKSPQRGRVDSSSEMQWVLSFLSNPDEVAHHDAEAKNLLFENVDRAEDDNYQYFLQELGQANLLSPQKPDAKPSGSLSTPNATGSSTAGGLHDETSSEDDEGDDDDWMEARNQIKKHVAPSSEPRTLSGGPATGSHKRRPLPRASHMDEILPPAAPVRFPPRVMEDSKDPVKTVQSDGEGDSDDNGLDALPRYTPPASLGWPSRPPPREYVRPVPANSSKLLALSHEIGQQLQKHGEFQFPKHIFRNPDSGIPNEVEREQVPEEEP